MAYLDDYPNRTLAQQRARRDEASGVIVVHTAESALDASGEDTGAEGVARYISVRNTYGSYHVLADSDSIVQVARFEMTTYGDGTGSNDHAIHISFACRAADWPTMSAERKAAFITNGAKAATEAATWLKGTRGIDLPARRINRAESDRKIPGFISHGERDPGRRTDPGPAFPWEMFLDTYSNLMEDDMALTNEDVTRVAVAVRKALADRDKRTNTRLARANELLRVAAKSDRNAADARAEIAEAIRELDA